MTARFGSERLCVDLAAARRARHMITDPLLLDTLHDYIAELEQRLGGAHWHDTDLTASPAETV